MQTQMMLLQQEMEKEATPGTMPKLSKGMGVQ
jgi:hypothetical protein